MNGRSMRTHAYLMEIVWIHSYSNSKICHTCQEAVWFHTHRLALGRGLDKERSAKNHDLCGYLIPFPALGWCVSRGNPHLLKTPTTVGTKHLHIFVLKHKKSSWWKLMQACHQFSHACFLRKKQFTFKYTSRRTCTHLASTIASLQPLYTSAMQPYKTYAAINTFPEALSSWAHIKTNANSNQSPPSYVNKSPRN